MLLRNWGYGAYERSVAYSKQRKAFGKEIMHHQIIQFKLADMATKIECARMLCLKAAWEKDEHLDYTLSGSMAKVFPAKLLCGLQQKRCKYTVGMVL